MLFLAYTIKVQEEQNENAIRTHLPAPHTSAFSLKPTSRVEEQPAHALSLRMGEFHFGKAWKEDSRAST